MEETTISEAHMDKCCDICGDVGAIYAIVTCTRCKISREHLYCMRTLHYDHPESWNCEECEDSMMASSLNSPGKLQPDSAPPNKLPKYLRRNPIECEKKMQTGKVKPLSAEEVIMLTSGAKISGSAAKASFPPHKIPQKSRSLLERTLMKTGGIPPKSDSYLVARIPSLELAKQKRHPLARQQEVESFAGPREKDANQAPLKKHTQSQEGQPIIAVINNADTRGAQIAVEKAAIASTNTSSLKFDQPIVDSGGGVASNMKIVVAASRSLSPLSAAPEGGKYLYIPASDASWKGSFNLLLNGPKKWEVSAAVQGHPPSRVHKKVYESSMLMPDVLTFELVQRASLWTSLFENYTPDSRDIGLYFFASSCERCKNYVSLLEHIGEQDMVLRNYMDGLELLVFTSKILQIDCQRWNGMYFLWGLFRRIKLAITPIQAAVNHSLDKGDNNEAVDMDIDMIGGQNVGKSDVVVPRITLQVPLQNHANETCSDVSPGFRKMQQPTCQRSCASATANETFLEVPPGFEKIQPATDQRSCALTAKSGLDVCVKVERLDEMDI